MATSEHEREWRRAHDAAFRQRRDATRARYDAPLGRTPAPRTFEDSLCVLRRVLFRMRDDEGGAFSDEQRDRLIRILADVLTSGREREEERAWMSPVP